MRDLKFRAWDKKEKRMIYLSTSENSSTHLQMNNKSWGVFEPDREDYCGGCTCNSNTKDILMQYIGLKDKNKKEIYDGDIVKRHSYTDYDNYYSVPEMYGVVDFREYAWCVTRPYNNSTLVIPLFQECEHGDIESIEVIGNIYENPELMKACAINEID